MAAPSQWFYAAFVATACLVVGTRAGAQAPENAHSAPPATEIVPLYAAGQRSLAMLTIGDGAPAPVVFDTGEDKAFLITPYTKQLKLPVIGSSPFIDEATGTRSTVPLVKLSTPKLSGIAMGLTQARVIDYAEPDMVGVVGPGVFPNRLVTLELSHNRVRVGPLGPDRVPREPGTPYFHELPALNIDVAGLPILAHLDSGSDSALRLSRSLMDKVKLKGLPVVVGRAHSASGIQDIYAGQIDGVVKIGPLTLRDPDVEFLGSGTGGNVGYPILRQLTLVMDPTGQRSWVLDPSVRPGSLTDFAGRFGPRTIRVEGNKLVHQRDGRPPFELQYLGGDLFEMPATGDRIQFYRKDDRVVRLELITSEGQIAPADRTS